MLELTAQRSQLISAANPLIQDDLILCAVTFNPTGFKGFRNFSTAVLSRATPEQVLHRFGSHVGWRMPEQEVTLLGRRV
jgi:hypothetical protein